MNDLSSNNEFDPKKGGGIHSDQDFFQVPEGFFEEKSAQLWDRIEEEELKEQAPLLFSISRKPFFQVPEGFFEGFARNLQAQLPSDKRPKVRVFRNANAMSHPVFKLGMVAAVLVIALGVALILSPWRNMEGEDVQTLLSDIPTDVLLEAVGQSSASTYHLAQAFSDNGVDESHLGFLPADWNLDGDKLLIPEDLDLSDLDLNAEWLE